VIDRGHPVGDDRPVELRHRTGVMQL